MKLKIYLATKNKNKLKEIKAILQGAEIAILPCPQKISLPEETGKNFAENAYLKARYLSKFLKGKTVAAEDSGLVVEKLAGLPGIKSARFSGKEIDHKKNIEKLLAMMFPFRKKDSRKAKFITVVCLVKEGRKRFFRGEKKGLITCVPRGNHGFGYDPVFEIPSLGKTFAEMKPEEKNSLSHRSIAFRKLAHYLTKRLNQSKTETSH